MTRRHLSPVPDETTGEFLSLEDARKIHKAVAMEEQDPLLELINELGAATIHLQKAGKYAAVLLAERIAEQADPE